MYLKIELTDAELRLVISCDITAVRRTDSRINVLQIFQQPYVFFWWNFAIIFSVHTDIQMTKLCDFKCDNPGDYCYLPHPVGVPRTNTMLKSNGYIGVTHYLICCHEKPIQMYSTSHVEHGKNAISSNSTVKFVYFTSKQRVTSLLRRICNFKTTIRIKYVNIT